MRNSITTGKKELLVSYRQMEDEVRKYDKDIKNTVLFINHTHLNREGI